MPPQLTAQQQRFFNDHLPHRVNLLIAFRQRYSRRYPESNLAPEQFRDLYQCAMDISMLMARFFYWEIGLNVPKGSQQIVSCSPRGQIYGATQADLSVVSQDTRSESLRKVLVAANRAVAHINPTDVDHSVDAGVLIPAIDLVESLVQTHIYTANGGQSRERKQPGTRRLHNASHALTRERLSRCQLQRFSDRLHQIAPDRSCVPLGRLDAPHEAMTPNVLSTREPQRSFQSCP